MKATSISKEVKQKVWERDKHKCIYCGREVPMEFANSHYIKRSQLGLGIEQNIVTACHICHYKYDFGANCKDMIEYTRKYLSSFYGSLNKRELTYHKYSNTDNFK